MSVRVLKLELRAGDESLATMDFERGCDDVFVGRSHACNLCTPADDHSVSGRHARLFWKGNVPYIEDAGSRNGTLLDGKRLEKPVKLEVGGVYGMGGCCLVVSAKQNKTDKSGAQYHQLEYLNGEHKGEVADICPKDDATGGVFAIGLDPACDIVLPDLAVSRRHASLTVKRDGSCWLQDLGSRNGTYVNGEKLSGKERFLQDGDKITIAYFDFRFLDRRFPHTRSFVWRKIGVLLVLLALIAAGVVVKDFVLTPKASVYRARAVAAAQREDFASALTAVRAAYGARGGSADQGQNDALSGQIKIWQQTYDEWTAVREGLSKGQIKQMRVRLASIVGNAGNWTWNDSTALQMRADAEFAASLIRLCYDALDDLDKTAPTDETRQEISARIAKVDEFLGLNAARIKAAGYLGPAVKTVKSLQTSLQELKNGLDKVREALKTIGGDEPDFTEAVGTLEGVSSTTSLSVGVRHYADELLAVCKTFQKTQAFLREEFELLTQIEFRQVRARETQLPLPDKNACAQNEVFSNARDAFQRLHAAYQQQAQLLAPMVRNLTENGIQNGEVGSLITFVCAAKSWEQALQFDCFTGRFPEPSRMDPTSVYDNLCGIECTYENLRNLPRAPGRQNSVRMKFVPKTQKAKMIFEQVRTFRSVLERPESRRFCTDKLGDLYTLVAKIMEMRDGLLRLLKDRQTKNLAKGVTLSRDRIVAGFFAQYFADETSYADLRALETSFKAVERRMMTLNEEYENETDPEKRLKIRKEIIASGIPGSEAVRKRWVELED